MDQSKRVDQLEARLEEIEKVKNKKIEELTADRNQWKTAAELASVAMKGMEKALDEAKADAEFGRKFKELMAPMLPVHSPGAAEGKATLENVKWVVTVKDVARTISAGDTTTTKGRLIKLASDGFFDTEKEPNEIVTQFSQKGWSDAPKSISNTLGEIFQDGFIARKRASSGKSYYAYFKPEDVVYQKENGAK